MVKQICKIKDVFDLFAGGDVNREHFSAYKTNTHVFGVYSNSLTNHGLYGYTDAPKYAGDSITITGRGSVGHAEYRQFDFDAVIRLLVLIPKGKDILDSRYVAELINNHVKFPLESTGVPQLTVPQIENIELSLPMVEEQRNIADALSDVDGMISSLEKLIAKKKAVKQGAMQELLTGKKRLPGFTGEWRKCKLKDVLTVGHGQSQHTIEDINGKYPILATGGIIGRTNSFLYDQPSVLIGRKGTIDKPQYMETPFWTIDTLFYTKIGTNYHAKYIFYVFCLIDWLDYNEASGVPSLSASVIENIDVIIPALREQVAISSILSDMDNEIEAMEQKLEKTRQIKQGMMQQLLTGKIRLIDDATNASAPDDSGKILTPKTQTNHNHQFDDAVMIAAVVNSFYSPKYRLGRKKVQKLLYLLRRKQEADTSAFKKKAAGPYADEVRYKGGEPIAKHNGYIETKKNNKGTLFFIGPKMASALEYIAKWQMQDSMDWLVKTFKYIGVEELELLATVDMAMCDLVHAGIEVSVDSIKQLIRSNEEWKAKLKKVTFSDDAIARAIEKCRELFDY